MSFTYSAAILAGGRSSRFGSDKARHLYDGKPLIQHVADSLVSAAERYVISDESYLDLPHYPDLDPQQGPLGGLETALHHAQHEWLAVAACDLPHLSPDYWSGLAKQVSGQATLVVTARPQPLAAFYHASILNTVRSQLARGERSLHALLSQLDINAVSLEDLGVSEATLLNVNDSSDLDKLA